MQGLTTRLCMCVLHVLWKHTVRKTLWRLPEGATEFTFILKKKSWLQSSLSPDKPLQQLLFQGIIDLYRCLCTLGVFMQVTMLPWTLVEFPGGLRFFTPLFFLSNLQNLQFVSLFLQLQRSWCHSFEIESNSGVFSHAKSPMSFNLKQ